MEKKNERNVNITDMDLNKLRSNEHTAWLRWVNALLLVIVGFFAKAILEKMDDGLKMLIIHEKMIDKHELMIANNQILLQKEIKNIEKEISDLREELKR